MNETIWINEPIDHHLNKELTQALNLHPAISTALIKRGVCTNEDAKSFFAPGIDQLHDPYLMLNMAAAVERINLALKRKERIMIYGDYDVDGTTAVAVVFDFINKYAPVKEKSIQYYIPNRYKEGYGISIKGIDQSVKQGCTLMIALDCGIKANRKIDYANENGLDVIVCDHHLPGNELPNAYAILNPKQKNCKYPFKELSGCGIGYKLIQALAIDWQIENKKATTEYLDLVATSIAADIVPMMGENRVLAYFGLMKANMKPCLPIKVLKETAGINRPMNISNLVFMLSPRINAAGRMDDANKAVSFFLEQDEALASEKAIELKSDNENRQDIDRSITSEALETLQSNALLQQKYSIVLHNPEWHKGVIGIVASRIVEVYYKPTIILTTSNDKITGSARSVDGFNIHNAISSCSEVLESFGGHQFAAGLTMNVDALDRFVDLFEAHVAATITEKSLNPKIYIDAEVGLKDLTLSFMQQVEQFEPCGPGNMMPIFIAKKVRDVNSRIVKNEHIQFYIQQHDSLIYKGIGFRMAQYFELVKSGGLFDIVFHVQKNEWRGNVSVEMQILDLKPSQ